VSYIYLASPYSHPDEAVRFKRFIAVAREAGMLMQEGHYVYSPIAHCHPIAVNTDLPLGNHYWKQQNGIMLSFARALWVLTIPGWDISEGIAWELGAAEHAGIPIAFHQPQHPENQSGKERLRQGPTGQATKTEQGSER